jgi:hypothetical protein
LSFEANSGQFDSEAVFVSRSDGVSLFLSSTETVFALSKSTGKRRNAKSLDSGPMTPGETAAPIHVVRMRLLAANSSPHVEGLEKLAGQSNYFIGNDPERWRPNIPNYLIAFTIRIKRVNPTGSDLGTNSLPDFCQTS